MRRLALLFFIACSSSSGSTVTSTPADAGPVDAGHVCARAPFATYRRFPPGINTTFYVEDGPRLSPDELTIYFHRTSSTGFTIFSATRPSLTDDFGSAAALIPSAAFPSLDGDHLYYDANPGLVPNEDIFVAPIATPTSGGPVAEANTASFEGYPNVSNGILYFASDRAGAGKRDLYALNLATKALDPLSSLNTAGDEILPAVSADGREIFFQRDQLVFTAWRDDPSQPFGTPEAVSLLNDTPDTRPGWLSPDGCRLYFGRLNDLWVGSR
jgi:hypothetical protein